MTFRLTIHRTERKYVVVCEIIVEAASYVMTFSVSVTIGELFSDLFRIVMIPQNRVEDDVSVIFCFGITVADVVSVVEVIVCEYVEFLESVVETGSETCLEREVFFEEFLSPSYWETATEINGSIATFALVFFKNDVDDTCCAFSVVTYRRVCHHFYLLNHIGL